MPENAAQSKMGIEVNTGAAVCARATAQNATMVLGSSIERTREIQRWIQGAGRHAMTFASASLAADALIDHPDFFNGAVIDVASFGPQVGADTCQEILAVVPDLLLVAVVPFPLDFSFHFRSAGFGCPISRVPHSRGAILRALLKSPNDLHQEAHSSAKNTVIAMRPRKVSSQAS